MIKLELFFHILIGAMLVSIIILSYHIDGANPTAVWLFVVPMVLLRWWRAILLITTYVRPKRKTRAKYKPEQKGSMKSMYYGDEHWLVDENQNIITHLPNNTIK